EGTALVLKSLSDEEKEGLKKQDRPEKEICQHKRQEAFDNYQTSDDHLMHFTGVFHDEKGTKYFKTKNSWGTEGNDYGGFLFMSETYFRYKTVAIMVHKDAVPQEIMDKLGL
ncbi:MAG: aminopeptidase, partial [Bacteroidales bacterium]|nr:aminopeptidase [Bacteroidales bacterium]